MMKVMPKIVYILMIIISTVLVSHGQNISIERMTVNDTILFRMIDNYIKVANNDVDSGDFIMIFVDPQQTIFCQTCECERDSSTLILEFPLGRKRTDILRIGFSIVPETSLILRDTSDFFKSKYLLRYDSKSVLVCSRSLIFDVYSHPDSIKVRSSAVGGVSHSFINYEYEPGVGVYRLKRTLILGREY